MGAKGVIFDFGGTIDTDGIHWMNMFRSAYEQCGLPTGYLREAYIYAERTLSAKPLIEKDFTLLRTLRTKIGLQFEYLSLDAPVNNVLDCCYGAVRENILKVSAPVLRDISSCLPLALVTNFYGNINAVLREFGLETYFRHIVESATAGVRKPDPEIFRIAVGALGFAPADIIVVGDSPDKDIAPAAAAGCRTVHLAGKGWDVSATCSSDYTITSLSALPLLISDN